MGYTHSWYRLPVLAAPKEWTEFLNDWFKVQGALTARGLRLAGLNGDPETMPRADDERIVFNGVGAESYEPFVLDRIDGESRVRGGVCFGFCKTSRLPYDLAVTSCLLAAARHFPRRIAVTSDGGIAEWGSARDIVHHVLGYGLDFTFVMADPRLILKGRVPA